MRKSCIQTGQTKRRENEPRSLEQDDNGMSVLTELPSDGAAGSLILDFATQKRNTVASTRIVFTCGAK